MHKLDEIKIETAIEQIRQEFHIGNDRKKNIEELNKLIEKASWKHFIPKRDIEIELMLLGASVYPAACS